MNFIIQILISIFVGICFVFLAKRYQKSQFVYFFIGLFASLSIRVFYLLIYGFVTDFKINQEFNYHKNLSILLSIIVSYLFFIILKKRLQTNYSDDANINEIGKE